MKKPLSVLLSVIILLGAVFNGGALVSSAANTVNLYGDTAESGDWQYRVISGGVEITGYGGDDVNLKIPSKLGSSPVVSIACAAFYRQGFESVTFPDSVKTIGWWAFYGCENLREVYFGSALKTVEYGAFMNCDSLKSVKLPMSVDYIGEDAFAVGCTTRKNVRDASSGERVSAQSYFVNENFSITGYGGTYAEKYAADNQLLFNESGTVLFGDINLDGEINAVDCDLLQSCVDKGKRLSSLQRRCGDVDNDGELTKKDIVLIKNYIDNKISYYSFPAAENLLERPDYLSGKSVYCDGDSVARGTGTDIFGSSYYSYCDYLAENYNITETNLSIPGSTIARKSSYAPSSNKCILERIENLRGDYDVILLDGGLNDFFQRIEIGTVTPESDKSGNYDEYTTAGALERICYILNENYPDALKLFVLCHSCEDVSLQQEYWSVMKNVLDKWGIAYVDLTEQTDFAPVNEEISTQYFRYKNGSGDGIHPLGYANKKIYGPLVSDKLNELASQSVDLSLNKTEIQLGVTENYRLKAEFSDSCEDCEIKFSSDNPSVAAIDESGNIDAKKLGRTTLRACTSDGKTASCEVEVDLMALELKLNKSELALSKGESFDLDSTVLYGCAAYYREYTSSDPSVAKVEKYGGLVTATGEGEATITCKAKNGVSTKCVVKVGKRV